MLPRNQVNTPVTRERSLIKFIYTCKQFERTGKIGSIACIPFKSTELVAQNRGKVLKPFSVKYQKTNSTTGKHYSVASI